MDLKSERQAITTALLQFDAIPAGMELFPAVDDDAWTLIKQVIDTSDYYLLVIGGRYGSIDDEGVSFTEKEYDYAVEQGKPVMAFLHGHPERIAVEKSDIGQPAVQKLAAFRDKVQKARHVRFWEDANSLSLQVIKSFTYFTKNYQTVGWVRGDAGDSPATVAALSEARKRIQELEDDAARQATEPPSGAAGLAGGADEYDVDCELSFQVTNLATDKWSRDQSFRLTLPVNWNQVLYGLGPLMLDEAEESDLFTRFVSTVSGDRVTGQAAEATASWISSNFEPGELEEPEDPDDPGFVQLRVRVERSSFETALLQLQALGQIERGSKKRGVNDSRKYWTLSAWGQTRLLQLRSIPAGMRGPAEVAAPVESERKEAADAVAD